MLQLGAVFDRPPVLGGIWLYTNVDVNNFSAATGVIDQQQAAVSVVELAPATRRILIMNWEFLKYPVKCCAATSHLADMCERSTYLHTPRNTV